LQYNVRKKLLRENEDFSKKAKGAIKIYSTSE
jgi:hypothetical protein